MGEGTRTEDFGALLEKDRREFYVELGNKLIHMYKGRRQELRKRAVQLNRNNPIEMNDLNQVNSMTFSLEWMKTG